MKKSRERVEKLKMKWQLSLPGKLSAKIGRVLRRQRSGLPHTKLKKSSTSRHYIGGFMRNIWHTLQFLFAWNNMGFKLGVAAAIIIPLFLLFSFLNLQLHPSSTADNTPPVQLYGDSTNIALIVYDRTGDYDFVNYLAVLSWNPKAKQNSLIVIDPDFGTSVLSTATQTRTVKLRNLLSNAALDGIAGMPKLTKALRNLLAIPIDRYIAVSKANAENLINTLGMQYVSAENFSDPYAGSFTTGETLTGDKLWNYLAATNPGPNTKMIRLAGFAKTQMESMANLGGIARILGNSQQLADELETNMSKTELVDVALTAVGGLRVQTTCLGNADGRLVTNKLGGYISPDYANIDLKVQKVLARIEVVKEQARIEIYNATRTTGLATVTKRLVENIGGNVIRVGNSADVEERTKLYVADVAKFRNNILAIQEVLRGKVILVDQDFPQGHTGDMVLVLGEDNGG